MLYLQGKNKTTTNKQTKPFKSSVGNSDNYWEYQKSRSTNICPLSIFSSLYLWGEGERRSLSAVNSKISSNIYYRVKLFQSSIPSLYILNNIYSIHDDSHSNNPNF